MHGGIWSPALAHQTLLFNNPTQSTRANSPRHHANCGKFHKCFASLRQKLIILAQSTLVIHPAECTLNYPSKFHDFKYLSWPFNDCPNNIEERAQLISLLPVYPPSAQISLIVPKKNMSLATTNRAPALS